MCVLGFSALASNISDAKQKWARYDQKLNLLGRLSKNNQMSNFTKIRLEGAELFNADGRTEGQTCN